MTLSGDPLELTENQAQIEMEQRAEQEERDRLDDRPELHLGLLQLLRNHQALATATALETYELAASILVWHAERLAARTDVGPTEVHLRISLPKSEAFARGENWPEGSNRD